jgi:hypothetical protein
MGVIVDKNQLKNFYIGTVFNFAGLLLFTLLPVLAHAFLFYIDIFSINLAAFILLFSAGIFYALSSKFQNIQLVIISANFFIFALFQFIFSNESDSPYVQAPYMAVALGILILVYIYFLKDTGEEL